MSRTPVEHSATMVIPKGVRIEMDTEGHLSIYAPGNLVVQNSGKYGTLESSGGSIRIDRGVEVEAVTVRCADTCYVQGFLTAWKVSARSLQLEDSARAHVVLQETQRLEIGRGARLVGNFSSEREMVGLFSRFAHQVRSVPFFDRRPATPSLPSSQLDETIDPLPTPRPAAPCPPRAEAGETRAPLPRPRPAAELPEPLLFAMVLLEREAEQHHPPPSLRAVQGLGELPRAPDLGPPPHT